MILKNFPEWIKDRIDTTIDEGLIRTKGDLEALLAFCRDELEFSQPLLEDVINHGISFSSGAKRETSSPLIEDYFRNIDNLKDTLKKIKLIEEQLARVDGVSKSFRVIESVFGSLEAYAPLISEIESIKPSLIENKGKHSNWLPLVMYFWLGIGREIPRSNSDKSPFHRFAIKYGITFKHLPPDSTNKNITHNIERELSKLFP
jgi:hypothetical protein